MQQQRRRGSHGERRLVDEVHVGRVDARGVVRQVVELAFVPAPVVVGAPVFEELIQVVRVGAGVPSGILAKTGPARAQQSFAQILEDRLGDADAKRLH
jgi:hypothetical protein